MLVPSAALYVTICHYVEIDQHSFCFFTQPDVTVSKSHPGSQQLKTACTTQKICKPRNPIKLTQNMHLVVASSTTHVPVWSAASVLGISVAGSEAEQGGDCHAKGSSSQYELCSSIWNRLTRLLHAPTVVIHLNFIFKTSQTLQNCPNWAKKGFIERKAWLLMLMLMLIY